MILKKCTTTLAVIMAGLMSAGAADGYAYIISGSTDIVPDSVAQSPVSTFVSGICSSDSGTGMPLDAQFRTWLASRGIKLKTTKPQGMIITIR